MDFYVLLRTQPWTAKLSGGEQSPWLQQRSWGGRRLHPPCHHVLCSALGPLLDWLAGACPGHAVTFLGHSPVFLLARALSFKMDAWSVISYTAQGRFKDFLGQWARARYKGEAPKGGADGRKRGARGATVGPPTQPVCGFQCPSDGLLGGSAHQRGPAGVRQHSCSHMLGWRCGNQCYDWEVVSSSAALTT